MKNSTITPSRKAVAHLLSRATLASGISAIAAIGFCPSVAHAADFNFASMADAVKSAQAAQTNPVDVEQRTQSVAVQSKQAISGISHVLVTALPTTATPVLSVGLVNHERSVVVGEVANFIGYSNYPGAVARGELRIFDAGTSLDGTPHFVKSFAENSAAEWTPTNYASNDMRYVYRVYDRDGRFDETAPQPLEVLPAGAMPVVGSTARPDFGVRDAARIRDITAHDRQTLLVSGRLSEPADFLAIEQQIYPVGEDGTFSAMIAQPVGCRTVALSVYDKCGNVSETAVAHSEWQAKPVNTVLSAPVAVATAGAPLSASDGGLRLTQIPTTEPVAQDYDIEVRADGHSTEPVMAIGLIGSDRVVVEGTTAQFQTYTNYPSYVALGEVRIFAGDKVADSKPLAVIATNSNGFCRNTALGSKTPRRTSSSRDAPYLPKKAPASHGRCLL